MAENVYTGLSIFRPANLVGEVAEYEYSHMIKISRKGWVSYSIMKNSEELKRDDEVNAKYTFIPSIIHDS